MPILCKCHFPLRWCKTLLHGTIYPPPLSQSLSLSLVFAFSLSRTAWSNIRFSLRFYAEQTFPHSAVRRDGGCAQESHLHPPLFKQPTSTLQHPGATFSSRMTGCTQPLQMPLDWLKQTPDARRSTFRQNTLDKRRRKCFFFLLLGNFREWIPSL